MYSIPVVDTQQQRQQHSTGSCTPFPIVHQHSTPHGLQWRHSCLHPPASQHHLCNLRGVITMIDIAEQCSSLYLEIAHKLSLCLSHGHNYELQHHPDDKYNSTDLVQYQSTGHHQGELVDSTFLLQRKCLLPPLTKFDQYQSQPTVTAMIGMNQ